MHEISHEVHQNQKSKYGVKKYAYRIALQTYIFSGGKFSVTHIYEYDNE